MEDELVQYIIVNKDLNMSTGKISAQVGHAVTQMVLYYTMIEEYDRDFWDWLNFSRQKKIVLQGKQKDLEKLRENENFFYVIDSGFTEIPENSLTVVALPPMRRSEAKKYVKRLQLFKDKAV